MPHVHLIYYLKFHAKLISVLNCNYYLHIFCCNHLFSLCHNPSDWTGKNIENQLYFLNFYNIVFWNNDYINNTRSLFVKQADFVLKIHGIIFIEVANAIYFEQFLWFFHRVPKIVYIINIPILSVCSREIIVLGTRNAIQYKGRANPWMYLRATDQSIK